MSTEIGLVACSSSKLDHAAPARELYCSALFQKSAAYAEATTERWYVLSAKHGLVHPDRKLHPYDARLGGTHGLPVEPWARKVRRQLSKELVDVSQPHLLVLAGQIYRSFLPGLPWEHEEPMAGLRIGEQLAWLTVALRGVARLF